MRGVVGLKSKLKRAEKRTAHQPCRCTGFFFTVDPGPHHPDIESERLIAQGWQRLPDCDTAGFDAWRPPEGFDDANPINA